MTHPTDWTEALKAFGEAREWAALPKRALRKFREFAAEHFDLAIPAGLAADSAFRHGYEALRHSGPAFRAACLSWQHVKVLIHHNRRKRGNSRGAGPAPETADRVMPTLVWLLAKRPEGALIGLLVEGTDTTALLKQVLGSERIRWWTADDIIDELTWAFDDEDGDWRQRIRQIVAALERSLDASRPFGEAE